MSFTCEFCNKNFATAPSLKTHINNAKYCLKLREKAKPAPVQEKKPKQEEKQKQSCFLCEHCDKSFTQKAKLTDHLTSCPKLPKKTPPKKDVKVPEIQQPKKEIQKINEIFPTKELDFSSEMSSETSEGEKLMKKYEEQAIAIEKDISEKNAKIEKMLGKRDIWEKISEKSAMVEKKMAALDIAKVESVDSTESDPNSGYSNNHYSSTFQSKNNYGVKIERSDSDNHYSNFFQRKSVYADIFMGESNKSDEGDDATDKISTTSSASTSSTSSSSSSSRGTSSASNVDEGWELGKFRYPTRETMEEFKQYYTFELYLQKEEGLVKYMKAMIQYQMFKDMMELERRNIFNKLK